jgi:hypothetical protein
LKIRLTNENSDPDLLEVLRKPPIKNVNLQSILRPRDSYLAWRGAVVKYNADWKAVSAVLNTKSRKECSKKARAAFYRLKKENNDPELFNALSA